MGRSRRNWLALLVTVSAFACYSPDLTTQVYRCDRGRCPDGLYCNDGVYCTISPTQCQRFGIATTAGVAVCIGSTDPTKACLAPATAAKCTELGISTELCPKSDSLTSGCVYCCTN